MTDNFLKGNEATTKLFAGIKKVSDVVGATMGTSGCNSLIEVLESPGHFTTNDGITIAQSMKLSDPIEDIGRKILLESVSRSNKASGDGSSTCCVLTAAIIEEGLKHLGEASPMEIKKSLEDCIPLIEESIRKQKREITVDSVAQVASISAEDDGIGAMIQEIYRQIGKDGIIHWDISKTFEDNYTIGKGIVINGAGFFSPYMCDANESGQTTNQIRLKNPKILITKQKITSAAEFNDLAGSLDRDNIKDLVVFFDEADPLVNADLVKTRMVRGFRIILVKMPLLWKDWWYTDLAKATGATVIDTNAGLSFKTMNTSHLGTCEHMTIDKQDTYLDGIKDIQGHVEDLTAEGSDDSLLRVSRLNTKTARYFVGAASDSALSYRRLKVEDALHSAYYALKDGVVVGGGIALLNASKEMPNTIGGKILQVALWIPLARIIANTGSDYSATDGIFGVQIGFDTKTQKPTDMFEAGIVDTASIVQNAARNAISVAASVLTAPIIITLPKEDKPL